jgi:beta-phosphoglucomutase
MLGYAFLFDMDGTIVDNMGYHSQSWVRFFANRGRAIDEDAFFKATAGRQNHEIMREYLGAHLSDEETAALGHEKEAVYRELYAPHLAPLPGFEPLVEQARAQGGKLAVATAAPRENVAFTLDGLDLRARFDAVVGAYEVKRGKPHPDVFLAASERVGVPPERCIVFEDAPLGVEAARRAGMRAVVLTTTMPAAQFADFDNVIAIAPDFTGFTLPALLEALDAHQPQEQS